MQGEGKDDEAIVFVLNLSDCERFGLMALIRGRGGWQSLTVKEFVDGGRSGR